MLLDAAVPSKPSVSSPHPLPPSLPLHLEQLCYHFHLRVLALGSPSPDACLKYESHHPETARRCSIDAFRCATGIQKDTLTKSVPSLLGICSRLTIAMHLTAALLFVAVTGVAGGWGCSCSAENGFCEKTGKCRCKPGWQGVHCERCIPFPGCLHGSCEKAWQCVCQQGWLGSLCDQDTRLCSSQPCSGNATCIETGEGGYLCVCPQGFTGPTCQLRRNICLIDGSPCQNGGTCTETGHALEASCLCPPGFSGNFCEITPDICHSNPCLNGGNCTDHGSTFACSCPAGFVGLTCNDTGFSPCAATPCANGATCVGHPDGNFRCVCPKWFSGRLCSTQHRPKAKPKQAAAKPADHRVFSLTPQHYSLPAHAFHKLLQPPERDLLKITLKETVHHSPSVLSSHGQLVCFGMLALLTCLVILATTGIVLFGRCEAWLVNAKYSKLVRQQREHLLKEAGGASREDTEHSVNIILPEKIRLNSFGKHYTSI